MLLCGGAAFAQPASKKHEDSKQPIQQVSPDDFVILITGACQTPPGDFAVRDCVRGITRQEFEDLVTAVDPNSSPESRQKLAEAVGQILILSNEAKKRELPKDPQVKEMVRLEEWRLLANLLLSRSMKQEASSITDAEMETFYREHLQEFQRADLLKVLVPEKTGESGVTADDKAFAESLRTRCNAGEDLTKLQADADQRGGATPAPPLELKNQRRNAFPAAQQSIFDLKPGQCSEVVDDGNSLVFYKMVSVATAPLTEVRNEITKSLQSTKMKETMEKLKAEHAISLNGRYFGPQGSPTPHPSSREPAPATVTPN